MKTLAPPITRTWTCILFDLDGTITDSAPGITSRLATTLREMGHPVPTDAELMAWVGPPILESFQELAGMSPAESLEALTVYRRHADIDGPYDGSAVYPGMASLIKQIHHRGIPVAVATSKNERQAKQILEHFGLAEYFTVITGASEDESRSLKADVIDEAIRRLTEHGIDLTSTVMVGDRIHDVEGAAEHNVPSIMVEWGYGSPAEAAGALSVVHSVDTLTRLLLG